MQPDSDGPETSQAFPIASGRPALTPGTSQKAFSSFDFAAFQASTSDHIKVDVNAKGEVNMADQINTAILWPSKSLTGVANVLQRLSFKKLPSIFYHQVMMTMPQKMANSLKGRRRQMILGHPEQRRRESAKIEGKLLVFTRACTWRTGQSSARLS